MVLFSPFECLLEKRVYLGFLTGWEAVAVERLQGGGGEVGDITAKVVFLGVDQVGAKVLGDGDAV